MTFEKEVINLDITNKCTLRCSFCERQKPVFKDYRSRTEELSLEDFKKSRQPSVIRSMVLSYRSDPTITPTANAPAPLSAKRTYISRCPFNNKRSLPKARLFNNNCFILNDSFILTLLVSTVNSCLK